MWSVGAPQRPGAGLSLSCGAFLGSEVQAFLAAVLPGTQRPNSVGVCESGSRLPTLGYLLRNVAVKSF